MESWRGEREAADSAGRLLARSPSSVSLERG
jgi:hypothetical protein